MVNFFDIFLKNVPIKNIKNIMTVLFIPIFVILYIFNSVLIGFLIIYLLIWLPVRRLYIPNRIARELEGNIIEKLYEINYRGLYNERPRIYKVLSKELNELLYSYAIKELKTDSEKIKIYNNLITKGNYKKLSNDEKYKCINYCVYNNKFNKKFRDYINDRYSYDETCRVLKDVSIYFNETISEKQYKNLLKI